MKFAKHLPTEGGPKRMLNLITAQVVTRNDEREASAIPTAHFSVRPDSHKTLAGTFSLPQHFFALRAAYHSPLELAGTFMMSLRRYLPHFTPSKQDGDRHTLKLASEVVRDSFGVEG